MGGYLEGYRRRYYRNNGEPNGAGHEHEMGNDLEPGVDLWDTLLTSGKQGIKEWKS